MIPLALGAHSSTYFENPSSVPPFAIVSFRNLLPFFPFLAEIRQGKDDSMSLFLLVSSSGGTHYF